MYKFVVCLISNLVLFQVAYPFSIKTFTLEDDLVNAIRHLRKTYVDIQIQFWNCETKFNDYRDQADNVSLKAVSEIKKHWFDTYWKAKEMVEDVATHGVNAQQCLKDLQKDGEVILAQEDKILKELPTAYFEEYSEKIYQTKLEVYDVFNQIEKWEKACQNEDESCLKDILSKVQNGQDMTVGFKVLIVDLDIAVDRNGAKLIKDLLGQHTTHVEAVKKLNLSFQDCVDHLVH